jgi:hypothetical protein
MAEAASTSPSTSPLSGFLKWVGGIAASVITAVLIYYLTRPAPPPPPPQSMEFYGVVADAVSHALIPNAMVVLALGSNSISQQTDALGKYTLVLESAGPGAVMGNVKISAAGYMPYSNTVPLQPGNNFAEITLQTVTPSAAPTAPAQPGVPGEGVAAPSRIPVHAGITLRPPPRDFVKRRSEAILHFKR